MTATSKLARPVSDSIIRRAREYRLAAELAARVAGRRGMVQGTAWAASVDAATIRAMAKRLDTYNVNQCNRNVTAREQTAAHNATERIVKIAAEYGATVWCGGDPRGPAVRLYWDDMLPTDSPPDHHTDRMLAVEV